MMKIDTSLKPSDLNTKLKKFWRLSAEKIELIEKNYNASNVMDGNFRCPKFTSKIPNGESSMWGDYHIR